MHPISRPLAGDASATPTSKLRHAANRKAQDTNRHGTDLHVYISLTTAESHKRLGALQGVAQDVASPTSFTYMGVKHVAQEVVKDGSQAERGVKHVTQDVGLGRG